MGYNITFTDNSIKCKNEIENALIAALYETAGEIQGDAVSNTVAGKVGGGSTRDGWGYIVDEKNLAAYIGNRLENAIWEELGTGEYALAGKTQAGDTVRPGRKGGWYIPIGEGKGQISERVAKAYGMTIREGKGGKKFVHTYGKRPKRALFKAYVKNKNTLRKAVEHHMKKL